MVDTVSVLVVALDVMVAEVTVVDVVIDTVDVIVGSKSCRGVSRPSSLSNKRTSSEPDPEYKSGSTVVVVSEVVSVVVEELVGIVFHVSGIRTWI